MIFLCFKTHLKLKGFCCENKHIKLKKSNQHVKQTILYVKLLTNINKRRFKVLFITNKKNLKHV